MQIADRIRVVLIGADQFSCSWTSRKVAVNYREGDTGRATVISLEIPIAWPLSTDRVH